MKLPLDGIDIKIKITLKDRLARYWTVNVDIALFDNTFLEIGLTYDAMYVWKLHKCLFSDSCRFKSNCYLWHLKSLLLQTLSHSDVKMKPSLIIFLLLAISCNANEILQLGQWLSTPSFDFSYLSSEEKSLCQKHLEYYTQSLTKGIPQTWALKSKSTIHVLF